MTSRRYLKADEIAAIRRAHSTGHRIVDLAAAYDAHATVISRIVHGKTHLAVTTQAEPLPNTDTVDARRARRAAQQRDDALAQAREAAARAEDARKDLEAAVQLAREATDRAKDARKGREAAELALKERVARESVQTPAPPATVEAERVQNPPPPSAIPAHHVSCSRCHRSYPRGGECECGFSAFRGPPASENHLYHKECGRYYLPGEDCVCGRT